MIKLVPDDCEVQNKNSIVVRMVCTWLDKNAPPSVIKVSLLFPVVGHSYIPPIAFLAESKERLKPKQQLSTLKIMKKLLRM